MTRSLTGACSSLSIPISVPFLHKPKRAILGLLLHDPSLQPLPSLIPKHGLQPIFYPNATHTLLVTHRVSKLWTNGGVVCPFALWPTVGGIYTVLQTKAKVTGDEWGDNYYLVGPYTEQGVRTQVELLEPPTPELKRTLDSMNSKGCKVGHNPTQGCENCQQEPSHRPREGGMEAGGIDSYG